MWTAAVNRKGLLDLVGSRNPFCNLDIKQKKHASPELLNNKEILLIWRERPKVGSVIPEMIWVKEGKIFDFLAWVSTYLSSFHPFTAYCRVLDCGRIFDLLPKKESASLEKIEAVAVAVTIGEAITHFENRDLKRVTPTAIMSTYSFAIARAYSIGLVNEYYNSVKKRWQKARDLTRQPKRALDVEEIDEVWKIIIELDSVRCHTEMKKIYSENFVRIVEACRELRLKGEIGNEKWLSLTGHWKRLEDVSVRMKERREDRVVWFEKFLKEIINLDYVDRKIASFVCGYLASRIAPGSIQHIELLRPYLECFPSIILWYSLCAGLYPKNDVYNFDRGLGWRLLRDLLRCEEVYQKPTGDISLEELDVLLDVERPDKNFRAASHNHLVVEILPSVYTVVIWPGDSATVEPVLHGTGEKNKMANNLLVELGDTLKLAQELYKNVSKIYQEGRQSESVKKEIGVNQIKKPYTTRRTKSLRKKGKKDVREQSLLDLKE